MTISRVSSYAVNQRGPGPSGAHRVRGVVAELVLVRAEEDGVVGAGLAAELRDELFALGGERLVQLVARLDVERHRTTSPVVWS